VSTSATERPLVLAVYNPDLLSKEDLIRGFVARKTLLERLLGDVRRETRDDTPPQPVTDGYSRISSAAKP
jgi:hypothetical protein